MEKMKAMQGRKEGNCMISKTGVVLYDIEGEERKLTHNKKENGYLVLLPSIKKSINALHYSNEVLLERLLHPSRVILVNFRQT